MDKTWKVEAVGTENGRSVVFLREYRVEGAPDERATGRTLTIPTSALAMSKLAEMGARVRNLSTRSKENLGRV